MRTPILAGNWKMNKTADEAVAFVREIRFALNQIEAVDVVVWRQISVLGRRICTGKRREPTPVRLPRIC